MASGTHRQLEQAYNLIQQDDLDGALHILRPLVASQPDNAEAWWLIANAVSEPAEAYEALDHVVHLNPQNLEAKEQLDNLLEQFPDVAVGAATSSFSATEPINSFSVDDLLGESPGKTGTQPAPVPEDYGAMFGKEPVGDDSALDLDSFFGGGPGAKTGGMDASENEALDAFFTGATSQSKPAGAPKKKQEDTYTESTFEGDEVVSAEGADQGRARGKDKEVAKPKPTRIKEPKPQPVVDAMEMERRANRRPNRSLVALLIVLIIVLAGGAFAVLILPNMLRAPAIPAPVANALSSASTTLTNNKFNGVKADLVGKMFRITICDKAGPALQDSVVKAMDLVAKEATAVKDSVDSIGLWVVSCSNSNVVIVNKVAPIDAVVSYVTGNMANKVAFHESWKSQ